MKVLALDFGKANIGIAHGDTTSGVAFPLEVIKNDAMTLGYLERLSKKRNIEVIVVGKPYRADNAPGSIDEDIECFIDELLLIGPEVVTMNERYTSKMADVKMHELGLNRTNRQKPTDDLAAQIILESWFEKE
ncbi:MAG: Holliday junction resolvase RuvX [Candidatus Gracilibacteria bacterium]|nr:Holliday junction resolvase RuvX [Candidatus Gracilibacteria bacterium]